MFYFYQWSHATFMQRQAAIIYALNDKAFSPVCGLNIYIASFTQKPACWWKLNSAISELIASGLLII